MITETIKKVSPILTLLDGEFGRDPRKNWALLKLNTTSSGEWVRAELEFVPTASPDALMEDIVDRLDAVDLSSGSVVRKGFRWSRDRSRLHVTLIFDATTPAPSVLPSSAGMLH